MKTFGWTLSNYHVHREFALMRADFYPTGFVLATSKRAVIVCDGESEIQYDGNTFNDVEELFSIYGRTDILDVFYDWEFKMVKEWVVKKSNGEFLSTFTTLKEMPFEKTCFKRKKYIKEEKA